MKIVAAIAVISLAGCHAPTKENQSKDPTRLLEMAAERVYQACYLRAVVHYQFGSPTNEPLLRVTMLFGPDWRCRVETPEDFVFFDGLEVGRPDAETGALWTTEMNRESASPIMVVGTMLGGRDVPLAVARTYGQYWLKHLMGRDFMAKMASSDSLECDSGHVVSVRQADQEFSILFCISENPVTIERFAIISKNQFPGDFVAAEYKSIEFPDHIDDETFRKPSLTAIDSSDNP